MNEEFTKNKYGRFKWVLKKIEMPRYIAYLRGINVSGQKKIKMVDLKTSLQNANFANVATYIQSGNIVFDSEGKDPKVLGEKIYGLILNDFGFEVPTLVLHPEQMTAILSSIPFHGVEEKNLYFTPVVPAG